MPRVPESAVTVGLPSVSPQPIREVLEIGDAVAGLTEASAQLATRLAEAERADELIAKSGAMEGALADLQLAIQQDPELNTVTAAGDAFKDGAEKIFEDFGQSTSPTVQRKLQQIFLQSSLQGGVSVRQTAFKRQKDASIAGLDLAAEGYRRAFLAAPDAVGRDQIRTAYSRNIALNGFLSDQDKVARILGFARDTYKDRAVSLIQAGLFDAAESHINSDVPAGVDAQDTFALQKTLDTAKNRAERESEEALKAVETMKTNKMLRRFWDPNDPDGLPTITEILDANFESRATSEHFLKMAEDHAMGKDINAINNNVYTNLYTKIYSGGITNFNQILPWVGNGISPEIADQLRLDIIEYAKPERKAEADALKILTDYAKASILGNALISGRDPEGAELFKTAHIELRRRFEKGLEEGKDPFSMATTNHADYIGGFVNQPPFLRSAFEVGMSITNAQIEGLQRGTGATPTPTPVPRITSEEDTLENFNKLVTETLLQ
jgi:hypothetical protein